MTGAVEYRISSIPSGSFSAATESVHYHLVDSAAGNQPEYAEEIFESPVEAGVAARERAVWLAELAGWQVHSITSGLGFLISSGRAHEAGRMIEVQECDDPGCLEATYGSMC